MMCSSGRWHPGISWMPPFKGHEHLPDHRPVVQGEKIEVAGVVQEMPGQLGLRGRQGVTEAGNRPACTFVQVGLDTPL